MTTTGTNCLDPHDEQLLAEGVAIANIPSLLMVLVQMTGETRWLDAPYRVTRTMGIGDNDTGGLPEDLQTEVREAALEAIVGWREGRPMAMPEPSEEMLVRMLSTAMGERIPDEYGEYMASLFGETGFFDHRPMDLPEGFKVLIIGAGVSGLCLAVNLQKAGVPFEIIERNPTVGGVWWENRYPGAGVDTPNHLYSYSFAPYDWKAYFCLQDELHGYLEHVSREFDVRGHIRFETTVDRAVYQPDRQGWEVEITNPDGGREILDANVVISAAGMFNPPVEPDIEGLDTWTGEKWHTARWPEDGDLTGKRVAIIGNGASCMQTAPEIQNDVDSLTIYQRSNHWAAPFEQFRKTVPDSVRHLFQEVPLYRSWYRMRLGWLNNDRIHQALHRDPDWEHPERSLNAQNDAHRAYFTQYVVDELGDKADELLDKVLPTYPPFGKRMLMDNGWYRMLRNPKVGLVDNPITRIDQNRVITADGSEREADVLVVATGFDVLKILSTYETVGRSGRSLREAWDEDNAQAYLGTVVPDFPNFFVLYGPNLQPGHGGSLIYVLEMQTRYIMDVMRQMSEQGIGSVEIRQDVHDRYNEDVDSRHTEMVWTHPGMSTYYRNERGRIVINSPYRNVDYYDMTRQAKLDEYLTEPVRATELIAD